MIVLAAKIVLYPLSSVEAALKIPVASAFGRAVICFVKHRERSCGSSVCHPYWS
jgi:hypothetical protein